MTVQFCLGSPDSACNSLSVVIIFRLLNNMAEIKQEKPIITDQRTVNMVVAGIIHLGQTHLAPVRLGFGIPTYQTVFNADGTWERRVNPALSPEDQAIYQKVPQDRRFV